jgi:hypothetical protein
MPTDTLTITDPNPITTSTPRDIPFEGVPTVSGSLLSMADDDNGEQTRFILSKDVAEWALQIDLLISGVLGTYPIITVRGASPGGGDSSRGSLVNVDYDGQQTRLCGVIEVNSRSADWFYLRVEFGGAPTGPCEIAERTVSVVPAGPLPPRTRYTGSTAQPVPADTDTLVAFENEAEFHSFISRTEQGDGHRFTFLRGGVWAVTATTRFVGGGGAGERYSALTSDNYGAPQVITADGGYNGSAPETTNLSYTGYFPESSYVEVSTWQNGSPSLDLEGAEIWKNITFVLITGDQP